MNTALFETASGGGGSARAAVAWRRIFRSLLRWLAVVGAAVAVCAVALTLVVLHVLRPAPGEWSQAWRLGPWRVTLGMPALLRTATHPFTLALIEGHRFDTRFGPLDVQAGDRPGTWRVVCAPCSIVRSELGGEPVSLRRVAFTIERDPRRHQILHGRVALGDGPQAVQGRWRARIDATQLDVNLEMPETPMADLFGLFGSAALPELARARIEGRMTLQARLQFPSRALSLKPRIEGFSVAGLGTEVLLAAASHCPAAADGGGVGTWLPRAVLAAEDQRFHEHAGYDLAQIVAAWSGNQRQAIGDGASLQGASTLSQQLAKLVYTGDRRNPMRKLRELLYAVELDRTLGKARVLHLYLAMAPWGDGQCGAHAAARHLLGKPAASLTPLEAAWLASLLHNPNAALARLVHSGQIDTRRVAQVIDGMRPMSAARRTAAHAALTTWRPAWVGERAMMAQRP